MKYFFYFRILFFSKTDSSEYSYFDSIKLKLFAGPYLWKYTNLLPDTIKSNPVSHQQPLIIRPTRQFRLNLFSKELNQTVDELMSFKSWNRKFLKKRKRKILPTTLQRSRKFHLHEKNFYQIRLSRKLRPLTDLTSLNYFPDSNLEILSNVDESYLMDHDVDDNDRYNFDPIDQENPFPDQLQYDFIRPIHYDKIEFDKNFAKVDAKKLQIQLNDEYNREYTHTSNPISLSTLCVKLIDQGIISYEKDQIVSAFYCMLNNCNKNHLYMKNNFQRDDLIIQKQPFIDSTQLIYSHSRI